MVRKIKANLKQWKRIGTSPLMLHSGTIIPAGETFICAAEDIPKAFRDLVTYIGDVKVAKPVAKPRLPEYKLSKAGKGWWNVLEKTTSKPVNSKRLRKPQAEALLTRLTT
jgi:hypothetical protein